MNEPKVRRTGAGAPEKLRQLYALLFFGQAPAANRENWLFLAKEGIVGVFAGLICAKTALFGTRPFALPLLLCSGEHLTAVFAGGFVGTLLAGDPLLALFLFLFFAGKLFLSLRRRKTGEKLFSPPAAAAAAMFGMLLLSLFFCVEQHFSFFSLLAFLFVLPTSGVLALLFYGATEAETGSPVYLLAGRAALSFCVIFALNGLSLFGVPLAAGGGLFLILCLAKEQEPFTVVIVALAAGLGCGPRVLPAMVVCGVCACIVRRFQQKFYPAIALLSAVLTVLYSEGYGALTGTLPSLLAGAAAYMIFGHIPTKSASSEKDEAASKEDGAATSFREEAPLGEEQKEVAAALKDLSELLYSLSAQLRRPEISDVVQLCEETLDKRCRKCEQLSVCLGKRAMERADLKNKIAVALTKKGAVTPEDLPAYLLERCGKAGEGLLAECSRQFSVLCSRLEKEDKSPAFAAGCRSAARLLQDSMEQRRSESAPDRAASAKAAEVAKELGISFEGLVVRGKDRRRLTVYGISPGGIGVSATKLQRQFGRACGTVFGPPSIRMEEGIGKGSAGSTLELESRPCLQFSYAGASRRKDGEIVCGDQYRLFRGEDGCFYAILSDGMGSGRDAAVAAGICCAFTEKLITCGGSPAGIVDSINSFLLEQPSECSATVDLMQLDPYSGKGVFVKSGAVPTLVLREGSIFKISSLSMPVGVTREINAEQIRLDVRAGDLIVLVSDGVVPDFESSVWLCKLLTAAGEWNPSLLAEAILEKSKDREVRKDDATVCVIRVDAA